MRPLRRRLLERRLPLRRRAGRRIEILSRCHSTSDALRQRLEKEGLAACDGLLLVAETQDGGRGRRRRDWWGGPPYSNLTFTLCLGPPPEPAHAAGLLAACALAAALRPWTDVPLAIKWPNDLLLGGAKLAGILAELPASRPPATLLGVGIDVHAAPPPGIAPYPTTSLAAHARRRPERETLLAAWLLGLERRWQHYRLDGPGSLEREFLSLLRVWAPHGVRAPERADLPEGPLLEFSVSGGLRWGPEGASARVEPGRLPTLEALPAPRSTPGPH